jgi:hypothetical protein
VDGRRVFRIGGEDLPAGATMSGVTQPLPPGPPAPLPPGPYQPPRPFNTYAIIAIVMACFVMPPLGIYFGHQAKKQIAVSGEQGAELAQAAIVVGWVFSIIIGVMLLAFCAFFVVWLGVFGAIFGTAVSAT